MIQRLPEALPDLFRLEWSQVPQLDHDLRLALAVLAYEQRVYTAVEIAELTALNVDEVEAKLGGLRFVVRDPHGRFAFTSESYRRFAAQELVKLRAEVNDLFIDKLLKNPDSIDTLTRLPAFLADAERLKDLVAYLSPERFARLYERSPSMRLVQQQAERGIAAAKALGRDADLVRFTIQKGAVDEMAGSALGVAEARVLTAVGKFETALALADQAPRIEMRLRLLAAIGRVRRELGLPDDPELTERIRDVFPQVEHGSLGTGVTAVAADLFYTAPDMAIELVTRESGGSDDSTMDWALLTLSVQAMVSDADPNAKEHVRLAGEKIRDPLAKRLSTEARVILGGLNALEAIAEASRITGTGDRLYVLQHWMLVNREREDAHAVLDYGLELALGAKDYSANARSYRELALCLPYVREVHRVGYYTDLIDAQRAVLERIGPTEEFIRLQLVLARGLWRHDRPAARRRMVEAYHLVNSVKDPIIRCASYARLLAALRRMDPQREMDHDEQLHALCELDFRQTFERLLTLTAEHFEAARGAITALAVTCPSDALAAIRELNTEWRRDQAYRAFVEAAIEAPVSDVPIEEIAQAWGLISDPLWRDSSVVDFVAALRARRLSAPAVLRVLPLLGRVGSIHNLRTRTGAAAQVLAMIAPHADSLPPHTLSRFEGLLTEAWDVLDPTWEKLELGYEVVTITAVPTPELARGFVERINELRAKLTVLDAETVRAATYTVQLAIRALAGLLKKSVDTREDLDRVFAVIERVGGTQEQVRLLSDLAVRAHFAGRSQVCSDVVQERLLPLLHAVPTKNTALRSQLVVDAAPALYLGAPGTAGGRISELPDSYRDEALRLIASAIVTKVPPTDPYERRPHRGYDITSEDANLLIQLMHGVTADWLLYHMVGLLCDSVLSEEYGAHFTRPARGDLVRQLEALIAAKLPNRRFIRHEGYKIAARIQVNRLRDSKQAIDPEAFAVEARAIPNSADRAYVLSMIATACTTARDRDRYFAEARKITDSIPMLADRLDHYYQMSKELVDSNPRLSKDLLTEAISLSLAGEGESIEVRRRSLIDLAYRISPEFASSLASETDDDPAKRRIGKQLRVYRLKDALTQKKITMSSVHSAEEYSRAAWLKLGALNANRSIAVLPDRILVLLEHAAHLPVSRAYPILALFVENAVRKLGGDAVRDYVLPLFEACLRASELTVRASSRGGHSAAQELVFSAVPGAESGSTLLVLDGERREALDHIRQWLGQVRPATLWIVDPYFRPSDMGLISLVHEVSESCSTWVLSSIEALRSSTPPYEGTYRSAWSRLSSDSAPDVTLTFAGTRSRGRFPIHDRWWLAGPTGLHLGTSFGGIGARVSTIRVMDASEVQKVRGELAPYFDRTRIEFEGERIDYTSFNL